MEYSKAVAEQLHILDKIEKLEQELLLIDGITEIEFDLSSFFSDIYYVIFLTKYDIIYDVNWRKKRKLKECVMRVAYANGLIKTEDTIEDYGHHFYWVFRCNDNWKKQIKPASAEAQDGQ